MAMAATTAASPVATRTLLTCGAVAGPLFLTVGGVQAAVRDGFDPRRHALSLLVNGAWGWVQIANLILTGVLVIAASVGLGRVLGGTRTGRWTARLIGLYGVGTVGAGVFTADPALGFPVGTPEDVTTISWHGMLHFTTGGIGFLGLIAACILFARLEARAGRRGWAAFSVVTGVVFFAGFAGLASGSAGPTTLAFYGAVVLAWIWLTAVTRRLIR